MNRTGVCKWLALILVPLLALSCKNSPATRPYREPPPSDLKPTAIDYVDADGFDGLFQTALTNQDPVIVIHTQRSQPDWGARLNAWIAAWSRGGKVDGQKLRGQVSVPAVTIDGDSIREFRLLVGGLMDRVDDLAKTGSAWWVEEKVRSRRVALLKPYNLRFHLDEGKNIELIFFNGNYARYYPQFMESITKREGGEPEEWSRTFECSRCKRFRQETDRLTSRGGGQ